MDFDVRPVPKYGDQIECSACGGHHIADEHLGNVWAMVDGEIREITCEWVKR
jgi:hypothetical protein